MVNNFFLRLAAQVSAAEVLLDELAHVGAGRFVRKIRGPEQTVIAEQLDVALGGDFFAALKIDPFSLQQLAGQGRRSFGATRSSRSSILLMRNGTQPQPASRKPSLSFFRLFSKPENMMLVN